MDNWRRRDAFKLAWEKDSLVPLEIMLTLERFSDGTNSAEAIADFYAQSYVFTNWLMRERPTELRLYMESLLDGSFAIADQRKKNLRTSLVPLRAWSEVGCVMRDNETRNFFPAQIASECWRNYPRPQNQHLIYQRSPQDRKRMCLEMQQFQ